MKYDFLLEWGIFGKFPVQAKLSLSPILDRGKFQKSLSRICGAYTLVFQAQISNLIAFGPEMAQRNGLKVFGLFSTFP